MRGTKPQMREERTPLADQPAPAFLSPDARAEWDRIFPILAARRILTGADLGCLENYCIATGTIREMDRQIQRSGAVQEVFAIDGEGVSRLVSVRKNPAVSVRDSAMAQARLLAAELGATPVSRSRPAFRDEGDDDDLSALDR